MKPSAPPPIPDEPYAKIATVDGKYTIRWGRGWFQRGLVYRRSARSAVRLRARRLAQMQQEYDRDRLLATGVL
jgi:hypothetical protein